MYSFVYKWRGHCLGCKADLLREARVWPRRRRLVLVTLHKRFFISSVAGQTPDNCVTSDPANAGQCGQRTTATATQLSASSVQVCALRSL